MRKIILFFCLGFFIFALQGCAFLKSITPFGKKPAIQGLPSYAGPKARIAVLDCEVIAAKSTNEVGAALRSMLVNALTSSNRFIVVPHQAAGSQPGQHTSFAGSDAGEHDKSKPDLIIGLSLVEFEPQASGGRSGIGGGGGEGSGAVGGLLGASLNKAHLALDIHMIDAASSQDITQIMHLKGQASDLGGESAGASILTPELDKGLSAYAHTPMEKAIRLCIIEAVRYISSAVPAQYYKYK